MNSSNSKSENELDHIVKEYRQEQEKQPNSISLQEDEHRPRTRDYDNSYLEYLNPMNRYIMIDLPWPQSLHE